LPLLLPQTSVSVNANQEGGGKEGVREGGRRFSQTERESQPDETKGQKYEERNISIQNKCA